MTTKSSINMTRTGIRPRLGSLTARSTRPSKIYTTPTWSRFLREDGRIEYTVSVPTRFGGRLFVVDSFDAAADRADVAARIRAIRRVLWGRDNPERASKPAWTGSPSRPASKPDVQPSEAPIAQTSGVQHQQEDFAVAADLRDGEAPPWNVEAAAGEATPAPASAEPSPSDQNSGTPQAAPNPQHAEVDSQMTLF